MNIQSRVICLIGMLCCDLMYAVSPDTTASTAVRQDVSNQDVGFQVSVKAQKTKKTTIGLLLLGHHDDHLLACAMRIKKDLEWSNQCIVSMQKMVNIKHAQDLKNIFDASVSVAIILSKKDAIYTWRMYDIDEMSMIVGQEVEQAKMHVEMVAHTIADELWPQLFGEKSSFRSKIAFCKQIWRTKHGRQKPYKQIWISDFDGTSPKLFIDAPTVSFAPRWNNNQNCPLLFYSQNTLSNVQLVMSNMFGKRKEICSFDGLNMQPTFSSDSKKVVFCLSKDGTSQLYLASMNRMTHSQNLQRLTFNSGNNIAPCFVDDTHVAFVSDYQTHKPQIYMIDLKTKVIEPITDGVGYCACPNYSIVRKQLLYSKMIGSGMQLFVYDLVSKQHKQITFDKGSKEEGSWSDCGNYIVFGLNQGFSSRIAQLHLPTGTLHYITSESDNCTYPACSPVYLENYGILEY